MKKICLLALILLSLSIIFVGCKKEQEKNNNVKKEENEKTEEIIPEGGTDSYSTLNMEYKIDKFIWDKEFKVFTINDLKITNNWYDGIYLGSTLISSNQPTDISMVPNYFFDGNKDYSPLERAYHTPHYAFGVDTNKIRVGKTSSCSLKIENTTLKDNLIIESIQLTGISNIMEDKNSELKNLAPYKSNNEFGFGSTYEYVASILGNDNGQATNSTGDFNSTTVVYQKENAEMTLVFSWAKEGLIEDALLTSIYWKPIKVSTMLHNQDGIYEFIGYSETKDEHIEIKNSK